MKAFIFDMDGVIIDSEPMHNAVIRKLMQHYHVDVTDAYIYSFSGLTVQNMVSKVKKEKGLDIALNDFVEEYYRSILQHVRENDVTAIEGIKELLEQLRKKSIPTAVASSSPKNFIEANINKLGFDKYFEFLMSGNEVTHGKPAPDIYLAAAKKLSAEPKDCVVLEDSHNGVLAAKAAGMICIGFNNPSSGIQDLSMADIRVDKINQIDLAAL